MRPFRVMFLFFFAFVMPVGSLNAEPIHDAAMDGDAQQIRLLLEAGADVNAPDPLGGPLYLALFAQHNDAALVLIEAGADPNYVGMMGSTLMLVVQLGNDDILNSLLAAGADPNVGDGQTPLMAAALSGRAEAVRLLLEHGAATGPVDSEGRTALHRAAEAGSVDAIRSLISYGADVQVLTSIGKPAIHFAAQFQHLEAVEVFYEAGWQPLPVESIDPFMETADLKQGKAEYEAKCLHCHPVERDRYYIGPEMEGVWGRAFGGLEDFSYSPALTAADGVWDAEAVNQYIAQPTQFLPGVWMETAGISDPRRRADIIAYLQTLNP